MDDEAHGGRFRLEIPAVANHLSTLRLFVASTGRALGLDEDVIADLKLAASEAASAIVTTSRHETVTIELNLAAGASTVAVGPLDPEDLTRDRLHPGDIIAALFPGAHLDAASSLLLIPIIRETVQ